MALHENVHEFYSLVYPIIPSIRVLIIAIFLVKEQIFGDEREQVKYCCTILKPINQACVINKEQQPSGSLLLKVITCNDLGRAWIH
jgi:hypothetical protein